MISINLLPQAYRRTPTASAEEVYRSPLVLGTLGLLGLVGIGIALFGLSQRVRVSELRARMQQMLPRKTAVDKILASMEAVRQQQDVFERVNQDRSQWAQRLNRLSDGTPDGVWFTDLSLDEQKGFAIQGSAVGGGGDEMVRIGRFVQALKTDQDFSKTVQDIQIESIKTSQEGEVETVKFTLIGKLASLAPAESVQGASIKKSGAKKPVAASARR